MGAATLYEAHKRNEGPWSEPVFRTWALCLKGKYVEPHYLRRQAIDASVQAQLAEQTAQRMALLASTSEVSEMTSSASYSADSESSELNQRCRSAQNQGSAGRHQVQNQGSAGRSAAP